MKASLKIGFLYLVWVVLGLILLYLATTRDSRYTVVLIFLTLVSGFVAMSIKCASCGRPVLKRYSTAYGREMGWTWRVPGRCVKCQSEI